MTRELGLMLREKRKQQKISQLCLAVHLGLESSQFISNIERGLAILPAKHIPTICTVLQIDKKELTRTVFNIRSSKWITDPIDD